MTGMTDDQLKAMFDALGRQIAETTDALRQETRGAIAEVQGTIVEMQGTIVEMQGTIVGVQGTIAEVRREITESADRTIAETRHLFRIEGDSLRHQLQLVAEADLVTREMLNREAADIREEVRRTANETQAMIKFSHAELDRRVSALEESHRTVTETLADMQARLDRLESSTH
jgi:SMC interacting uncharacterized protein involved in chromosome segregation